MVSPDSKTNSGKLNCTYLNNFKILNKVLKKQFETKNFEIKNLVGTPTCAKRIKVQFDVLESFLLSVLVVSIDLSWVSFMPFLYNGVY